MDKEFSIRLITARKYKGITQKDAAGFLKISPKTLNLYEHGTREPGREVINRMATLYECSGDWILTGNGTMKVTTIDAEIQVNPQIEVSDIVIRKIDPARNKKADFGPAPSQDEEDELIDQTRYVVRSNTPYRGPLISNVRAFYYGAKREIEVEGLQEQMNRMEVKHDLALKDIQTKLEMMMPSSQPDQKKSNPAA